MINVIIEQVDNLTEFEVESPLDAVVAVYDHFNGVHQPSIKTFVDGVQVFDECDLYNIKHSLKVTVEPMLAPLITIGIGSTLFKRRGKKGKEFAEYQKSIDDEDTQSPNNQISDRSNSNRLGGRIPDIFGTVVSIPDEIFPSYRLGEYEIGYYCVGRGSHNISQIKDGSELISNIFGASVEVYGPNSSPNFGTAQAVIGAAITESPGTKNSIKGTLNSFFYSPTTERVLFKINASPPTLVAPPNPTQININFVWRLVSNPSDITTLQYGLLNGTYNYPINNPYWPQAAEVAASYEELYEQYQNPQSEADWYAAGNPPGSYIPYLTKQERLTFAFSIEDVFDFEPWDGDHFGDVTTIFTKTKVTTTADASEERRLNCLAQRVIPQLLPNYSMGSSIGTDDVASIIVAICRDEKIGNLDLSDIDLENLRDTVDSIATYFGTTKCIEFGYSFDSSDLSFEETVAIVAEFCFCSAYREDSKVKLFFEQPTDISSLLLNPSNKLPNSETRELVFGNEQGYDGVEIEYVNHEDGGQEFETYPELSTNPDKIPLLGCRSQIVAYFHSRREYAKQLYENEFVKTSVSNEGALLRIGEVCAITDSTRENRESGEILAINGSELTLSFDVSLDETLTYTAMLQNSTGEVVLKTATQGSAPNKILLDNSDDLVLNLDPFSFAVATCHVTQQSNEDAVKFIVTTSKQIQDLNVELELVNYDDRYYLNDKDLENSVITIDSNGEVAEEVVAPPPA